MENKSKLQASGTFQRELSSFTFKHLIRLDGTRSALWDPVSSVLLLSRLITTSKTVLLPHQNYTFPAKIDSMFSLGLWVCFVISLNGSRMVLVLSMRKGALVLQADLKPSCTLNISS